MFMILAICLSVGFAKIQACQQYNIGLDANNPKIPDNAFRASSMLTYGYRAERGRLNTKYEGNVNSKGSWLPSKNDNNPWIIVDLQKTVEITGVITQGRQCGDNWVKTYNVDYSTASYGENWFMVLENGGRYEKTFNGNSDRNGMVKQYFPKSVQARRIRIRPITWQVAPGLRFEVIACK